MSTDILIDSAPGMGTMCRCIYPVLGGHRLASYNGVMISENDAPISLGSLAFTIVESDGWLWSYRLYSVTGAMTERGK